VEIVTVLLQAIPTSTKRCAIMNIIYDGEKKIGVVPAIKSLNND
jgi:hypothetical protein